ncbi:hypothetical protein B0O40_1983 [Ruminococcaceae bacterium R-25]|nr:hypothetical protein B0O40_1983 [Ruminococcaceae bacterium R-25]SUQ21844.1 hypothetical protein SAMN06297423_1983 [Oscillospiraceae bacterium]
MIRKKVLLILAIATAAAMSVSVTACLASNNQSSETTATTVNSVVTGEEITNANDGEHAIEVSGNTAEYSNIKVTKTGDSASGDEADFYGDNAAIFATDGATLTLTEIAVDTNGTHANAVFSYGNGTTVNISNSVITTSGNCSGGLMTTGGGTMNASNLDIHTTGNSSAAIRSDRGGGTVTVDGGTYVTDGTGSPAIYSTADITVSNATLESTQSEGVVVEGKNSVTLNNVNLTANNTKHNSDKSISYNAVMIYQSMSGDASVGLAKFTMSGGSITNKNGDIFFVNNTATTITLENVEIVNQDSNGVFLREAAAGWGSEGSNGGKVNLYLKKQAQTGDIIVDNVSALNLYLSENTTYTGAINAANEGEVYVEIEKGSTWVLTGDSYITGLTCEADAVDLNGHKLYVGGTEYTAGTSSTGTAITIATESSGKPDGMPGEPPSGGKPDGEKPSGDFPGDPPSGEKPSGNPPGDPPSGGPGGNGGEPPAKPSETTT